MSELTSEVLVPRRVRELFRIEQVKALLSARSPQALDDEHRTSLVFDLADGIATEVAHVVGDPPPEHKADRVAWCLALGVAASLESSLFPTEQDAGDSRAESLRVKYLAVKAELASDGAGPGGVSTNPPGPRFSFPPASSWPDQRSGYGPTYIVGR